MSLETLKQIGRIPRQYWRKFNSTYLAPHGLGYWRPLVPAEEFTVTVAQSLDVLLEQETISDLGAYLEFGVSRGTSMSCVHRELTRRKIAGMRLVGFDSFEGMPEESAEEGWTPGAYRSTLAATKAYMASQGVTFDNVELVKGWFDQTLTPETKARLGLRKASIINYDCDTYSATKLAMEFSLPLIERRAVVIFDDWGRGRIGTCSGSARRSRSWWPIERSSRSSRDRPIATARGSSCSPGSRRGPLP